MECQKQTIDNEIIKPRQFQFVTFEKPPATETLLQTHAGDVCAQSKKIPRSQHHIILHINSTLNFKFSSNSSYQNGFGETRVNMNILEWKGFQLLFIYIIFDI